MSDTSQDDRFVRREEPGLRELRDLWQALVRRRAVFALVFLTVLTLGAAAANRSRPVYRASAKLLVPVPPVTRAGGAADSANPLGELLAPAQPAGISAQRDQLLSLDLLAEARRAAGIERGSTVSVKVSSPDLSDVITIAAEGYVPRDTAALANALADLHLERTRQQQSEGLEHAIRYVRAERDQAARELTAARRELADFLAANPVDHLASRLDEESRRAVSLEAAVRDAQGNLAATRAQLQTLRQRFLREPADLPLTRYRENPLRPELERKLGELRVRRVEMLRGFLPASPQIQDLDEQIAEYGRQLQAEPLMRPVRLYEPNPRREIAARQVGELEAALVRHRESYETAAAEYGAWRASRPPVHRLGALQVRSEALTQERSRAQARFNLLSDRLQDLEIRKNARTRIVRLIDRAVIPTRPVWPPKGALLAVVAGLALLLATGAALLKDHVEDRVISVIDAERCAGLPALGYLPRMPEDREPLLTSQPQNAYLAEACRGLRVGIRFAANGGRLRRIQITSAGAGEGKTLTAVNLAAAMAMDGRRVVLVDADLRHPQVHHRLCVAGTPGLAEVLAGALPAGEALQSTSVTGLSVLASGSLPQHPAEQLGSPAFERLLTDLEQLADVVILDTPSCLTATDPLIVAPQVDAAVVVVRSGVTRKIELQHALALFERARIRVLGSVLNDARPSDRWFPYSRQRAWSFGLDSTPEPSRETNGKHEAHAEPASVRSGGERAGRGEQA